MTFDLTNWQPIRINGSDPWVQQVYDFCLVLSVIAVLLLFMMFFRESLRNSDNTWVKKHHVAVSILLVAVFGSYAAVGVKPLLQHTPQTTTIGTYIDEQAKTYTPSMNHVQCDAPTAEKVTGRYSCTWDYDGKPVHGSVNITGIYKPREAQLLDSHGNTWCPAEWSTDHGCIPINK